MAATPYQKAWESYLEAGYTPLPLPPREKFPPPSGWTGGAKTNSGKTPPEKQCKTWAKKGYGIHKAGNIAVRLPKDVVGIDVDMYDGKAGRETLAAAEAQWGALPPTWTSTSRTDGSGIRFFRVPPGLAWESQVGGAASGIEIVRWDHRYAVVFPSMHPNGEQYVWVDPNGEVQRDWVPAGEELAAMPEAWVEGLTNGHQEWTRREEAELTTEEISGWLETRPESDGDICTEIQATLDIWIPKIQASVKGGGLHEAGLGGVWGLLRDAAHGHKGIRKGLAILKGAFRSAAEERGKGRKSSVDGEWFRFVSMGVCKVAAEVSIADGDPCEAIGDAVEWTPEQRLSLRAFIENRPETTDIGNAKRFHALFGEDVRWHVAEDCWLFWGGDRWRRDRTGRVESWAKRVPEWIENTEAAQWDGDDLDWFKSLKAHAKKLGMRSGRYSMLEDFKSMRDVTVVPEQLDADARLIQCEGKLIRLAEHSVEVALPRREAYQTLCTNTPYEGPTRHELWETFLKRSIPDDDVRRWVQKAVGYSLLGDNRERLIFFIRGETSTGKSVFAEALGAALGDYSTTFDLTLFRSQKEQGPNVQLVRLLDKRIVFTSETSSERYLHADQLKRATGGERMEGRLNRSNEMVSKIPAFTPWIMTNNAPTIKGADQALYRRLRCVPFNEMISEEEQDPNLRPRLAGEGRAAVLAWAIEGWQLYAEEGLSDIPSAIALATMELRGELSEFDIWMQGECEFAGDAKASTQDLFDSYQIWCADSGIKDMDNKIVFAKRLAARFGKPVRVRVGPRAANKQLQGFAGVRLRAGE